MTPAAKKRKLKLGSAKLSLRASSKTVVKLKVSKAGIRILRRGRKLKTKLTATVKDPAGQTRRVTTRVTLKRAK